MKRFSLSSRNLLVYKLRNINNISKEQYKKSIGLKIYNFFINLIVGLGCNDIRSTIPLSTHFSHNGVGVIISPGVKVGECCVIGHNVTLGERGGGVPTLGDCVVVHAHSIIMGDVMVGDFAVVGAGSVVLCDVPSFSVVIGNPARVLRNISEDDYMGYRFGCEIGG